MSVRDENGGRLVHCGAPTALLRRGHTTLFGWILTWAPQAELDKGARRTLQTLRERGALPYADRTARMHRTTEHMITEHQRPTDLRAAESRVDAHRPPGPRNAASKPAPTRPRAADEPSARRRPGPPMPAEVSARLDAVLAAESARRQAREAGTRAASRVVPWGVVDRKAKPDLVTARDAQPVAKLGGIALVAAVSAAAVGRPGTRCAVAGSGRAQRHRAAAGTERRAGRAGA